MAKYEGVGEFGRLLADAINSDSHSLTEIAKHLGIWSKTILGHIRHKHKPQFYTIQIYSIYLDKSPSDLIKMIDLDYDKKLPDSNDFSRILYNAMVSHGLSSQDLSERIGVSHNSVLKWLRGQNPSSRSYIKCMQFFLDLEGNTDYKSETKLKEIL